MKNHEFQELVDQNLSGLVWDERKRQRVLHAISEEEKTVKKISTTFILVAAIFCLTVSALAAGIMFSKKVENAKLADDALLAKYGITSEMMTFFSRTDDESEGYSVVRYESISPFSYVLGTYSVVIQDGKADASWSREGSETGGGFDADAWGVEQLNEMLHVNRETHDVSQFARKAEEIAARNGVNLPAESVSHQNDVEAQLNAEKAKSLAKLSIPEMEKIAREALAVRYSLTQEQAEHLRNVEDNGRYLLFGIDELQRPCYEFYFALGYDEDGYQGTGAGIYTVKVNVENGMVEDLLYDSALAGNG